jgi:hypothetical protein
MLACLLLSGNGRARELCFNRVMQVPAAGMGASGPDKATVNPVALPANSPSSDRNPPLAADSVAALLGELSQSDLTAILRIIEGPSADDPAASELLRAAGAAAAGRDIGRVLDLVRQLAHLDPLRAEALASAPAFAPYRAQVEQLLAQLAAAAKLHAEGRLANATQILETGTLPDKSTGEVRPEVFLLLANKFIEVGGLSNYVRSSVLSTALLDRFPWVPPPPEAVAIARTTDTAGVAVRWVIAVWIALGVAGLGLCWWLRSDYLPVVCGAWAVILVLLIVARRAIGLAGLSVT